MSHNTAGCTLHHGVDMLIIAYCLLRVNAWSWDKKKCNSYFGSTWAITQNHLILQHVSSFRLMQFQIPLYFLTFPRSFSANVHI